MITRKEKREEKKKKDKYFFDFLKIKNHFYKGMNNKLKKVKDPRHPSYITYDSSVILMMVIMKNTCNIESMREMTDEFNVEECFENLSAILGIVTLAEIPHYDTINNFLSQLHPSEIEEIRTYMIKEVISKKSFYDYRIIGKYWGYH